MKKLLTGLLLVAIVGAFSGCKKDYTCQCTLDTAPPATASTIIRGTKKKTEEECVAKSSEINGVAYDCIIL